jgi:hypothetical protein
MTTTQPLDAPLLDATDATLARPLAEGLAIARADVVAAASDVLATPESSLDRAWGWIGGSEVEIRYGAYRAAEALELAEIDARVDLAAEDAAETQAARIVAAATAARWDLHGLLLPLADSELDADPGGGEWTIRLTLGHVINGQRAYGWSTAWWAANPHELTAPDLPARVPEEVFASLPDEETTEAEGTVDELRARLDAITDLTIERLAGLPDERLALGARWSGFPVTIGFRLGRWSSHIREHTIQVEKTCALLGRNPTEPERLARHLLAAYGRAEATVIGRRPGDATTAAGKRVALGAAEALEAIQGARIAGAAATA